MSKKKEVPNMEEGNFISADELLAKVQKDEGNADAFANQVESPVDLIDKMPVRMVVRTGNGKVEELFIHPPRMRAYLRGIGGFMRILKSVQQHSPDAFTDLVEKSKKHGKAAEDSREAAESNSGILMDAVGCCAAVLYAEPEVVFALLSPFLPDAWDEEKLASLEDPKDILTMVQVVLILVDFEKLIDAFRDALPMIRRIVGRNAKTG